MRQRSPNMAWLGLAVLVALIAGCSEQAEQAPASADAVPSVAVLPVTTRPFSATIEFVGRIEAKSQVDIRARVSGVLQERAFSEGTNVERGDLLFRIDPAEFNAALAAAEAGVARVSATLAEAEADLARKESLVANQTVTIASRDESAAAVAEARADLQAANAEVDKAKLDLGYTEITTPISGRAGEARIDVGNLIGPDSGTLVTIVSLDPIRVEFSVSEQIYLQYTKERIEEGDAPVVPRIRLADNSLYPQEGVIQFADNQVDRGTGTVRVFVEFPNPDQLLLPGQFVTVILSGEEPEDRILIPQAAIQISQAGSFVLVVDSENRVAQRAIVTGDRDGREIVVTSGLEPGETIIVDGIQKVRPGATVDPVQAVQAELQQ